LRLKDKDKDKDFMSKDEDKDKDLAYTGINTHMVLYVNLKNNTFKTLFFLKVI